VLKSVKRGVESLRDVVVDLKKKTCRTNTRPLSEGADNYLKVPANKSLKLGRNYLSFIKIWEEQDLPTGQQVGGTESGRFFGGKSRPPRIRGGLVEALATSSLSWAGWAGRPETIRGTS